MNQNTQNYFNFSELRLLQRPQSLFRPAGPHNMYYYVLYVLGIMQYYVQRIHLLYIILHNTPWGQERVDLRDEVPSSRSPLEVLNHSTTANNIL